MKLIRFISLLALATCFASADDSSGLLRFSIRSEPRTLDPLLVDDSSSETVRYLTGGALVRIDRVTQKLVPELATRWRVSADGRRIDFELRRGIQFSDGTPFGPEDVVFTIERLMAPETHSPVADSFRSGTGRVVAHATGTTGVSVLFPALIANLPALFDQVAIMSSRSALHERAVLGPFVVSEQKAGVYLLLKRNPHYWERDERQVALPYLSGIRLDVQGNRETELLGFERGETDLIPNVDAELYDRLSRSSAHGRMNLFDAGPSLDSEQLWFNLVSSAPLPAYKKEWFQDVHFRHGISEAIRRTDLCRMIYHGHAVPAVGPVSKSNAFWFNKSLKAHDGSVEFVNRELTAGGFHKQGSALVDRHGNAVEFSLITNGNKVHERMLAMIQQDLQRFGIKLNVVTLDFASLIERITRTFAYESCLMFLTNVGLDPNEQMNVWLSSAENHQWNPMQKAPATAWEAEIDRLMRQQASSNDSKQRKRCFDRVQEIVREQEPFIYLVNPNALSAVSKRVQGVTPALLPPHVYWNAARLSLGREEVSTTRDQPLPGGRDPSKTVGGAR